jgi:tellurite resistance protein TerC
VIFATLTLELGLFQRKPHVIGEAMAWFGVWIALALIFNIGVILFYGRGGDAGLEFSRASSS